MNIAYFRKHLYIMVKIKLITSAQIDVDVCKCMKNIFATKSSKIS